MQAPLLAYNHFVESMFVLNGCRDGLLGLSGNAMASQGDALASQSGSLGQDFGLKGSSAQLREKRVTIYR